MRAQARAACLELARLAKEIKAKATVLVPSWGIQ
jgi:hypothetical protein